ncbi:MAG: SAM-dependent DNA methyltransferase [Cyanobacteria bacterium SBLK]|nr:SAM-dependent DNA methyltransferase [Cyanobacteria bacterium SBLK]
MPRESSFGVRESVAGSYRGESWISPDFNRFGDELWDVANILRDDAVHLVDRLEIFSLFLFLKLWDEIALEEEAAGKSPPEQQLIPEKYRFHNWAEYPDRYAESLGFEDSILFCRQMFTDLANRQSKHDSARDLRRLFKDARFPLRYTTTVRSLASKLAKLNLREIMLQGMSAGNERFDILGRTYEYLLQRFAHNKEFAEYFTPRHVVDRIVEIMQPQIGESIYDPACGTGGFIVRAFEFVRREINQSCRSFSEKERLVLALKTEHLNGVEFIPIVFKLALMNMILHQDGSSQLANEDSLSHKAQDKHKNKYDLILANPPFGPTNQERLAVFEFQIKLYEALFVQHVMNALKPGGRAAVVVKEGLLFDSKGQLRKICRKLVEQFELLAAISLPNGVFNPYSGSKTSVIVFRRPLGREDVRTSKVWFYRVESDGRDLGATRRKLADFDTDGDLKEMTELFPYRWQNAPHGGVRAVLKSDRLSDFTGDRAWWADLQEIRETNYNLTAGRYCPHQAEAVEYEKPAVLINRLLELEAEITTDLQKLLVMVSNEDVA